jgi:hypothetical protein
VTGCIRLLVLLLGSGLRRGEALALPGGMAT